MGVTKRKVVTEEAGIEIADTMIDTMHRIRKSYTDTKIKEKFNPNKAGLFEGSFSWGWGQFDPPFIFQEELI